MRWRWLVLLTSMAACGGSSPPAADAGPEDAARRDAARPPPLPRAADVMPPARYDCTATGIAEAPARPHPADCYRDPACASPLVAAHRMGTPFAPENSLAALRASILLGVDLVETDVRLTADGEVVLLHDSTIDRTVEGTGAVGALTLAQLQALPLKVAPTLVSGDFSCERVPTLQQAMAIARGQIIVELEVKDTAAGVAAATYLRDEALFADAFLLCDADECAAVRAAVPDAPIMSRPREASEVPSAIAWDPPPILVHVDPDDAFLAPEVVAQIHGAGARVYANAFIVADAEALTLNDPSGYPATFARGVEVLQTEFPHWALGALGR